MRSIYLLISIGFAIGCVALVLIGERERQATVALCGALLFAIANIATGSPFIMTVVPFVSSVVAAAILVAKKGAARASARETSAIREFEVDGVPQRVYQQLQLQLAGMKNVSTSTGADGTLHVVRTYIPTWAIVIAVITFPIGLLALFVRREDSGTLIIDSRQGPAGSVSIVQVGGKFNAVTEGRMMQVLANPFDDR